MQRRYLSLLAVLCLIILNTGKVRAGSRNHFFQDKDEWFLQMAQQSRFPIDTSAVAIILYEKCVTEIQLSSGSVQQDIRRIIKILRKSGTHYGDFRIQVPTIRGGGVDIRNVRGTTYRYNGSELASLKLNTENLAKNKSEFLTQTKGSMPGVEEGAVLDISYSISQPIGLKFAEWEFQHEIPTLYSELEVWVPEILDYYTMFRGSAVGFPDFDDTRRSLTADRIPQSYRVSEPAAGNDLKRERWVRRNIDAVVEEPMAPELSNFQERLQLRINMARSGVRTTAILDNWPRVNKALYGSFGYYQGLRRKYPAAMEKTAALIQGLTDPTEKARKIYGFVRSSLHANGYTSIFFSDDPDKVLLNRSGTPSEINSLLMVMLWYAGIPAKPIIIATSDIPTPAADFPDIGQFNRTICQAHIGSRIIYLDASEPNVPFGVLPRSDYNGYARVIDEGDGTGIELNASVLNERSQILMTMEKEDLQDYVLRISCRFGTQEARACRNNWQKDSSLVRKFLQPCINRAGMNAALLNYQIDGLHDPDANLTLSFTMRLEWPKDGKAYFNPHLISPVPRNPFIAANRTLPIQLPATQDAQFIVNIRVPEGYKLEESPQAAVVNVNTGEFYKYLTAYDDASRRLQINSSMHMERTWYPPTDYELIRQFYDKVVAQHEATYVFSK